MIRILVTLVLAAQGCAAADCSDLVARALEAAGVNDEIAALPGQIQSQFAKMSDADQKKLEAALTQAFLPEKIDRELKRELLEPCDPGMLQSVIASLTNPLGERMRRLKAFAESPAGRQQQEAYAHSLAQRPPARERLMLMVRMDASLGVSKSTTDLAMASAHEIAAAFGGLPDGPADAGATSDAMHGAGAALANLLFTYRDVSDQDLKSWVELYETPAFTSFNHRLEKALVDCMQLHSEELEREIKKMVPPR